MSLQIDQIVITPSGKYLKLISKTELLFNFIVVEEDGTPILERKTRLGIHKNTVSYTSETISTFKKVKNTCQK
ncbi:hypothetical protein [Flavobacterium phage FL-1]|nr:hypothetical protein [Flavobacterium phage FL-1]